MAAVRKVREDMSAPAAPDIMQESSEHRAGVPEAALSTAISMADLADAVREALRKSKWDWRTARGLARDVGFPESLVIQTLEGPLGPEIVRSLDSHHPGCYFYTTRERYEKIRGLKSKVLSFITGQTR